jgi:hypothetical protein
VARTSLGRLHDGVNAEGTERRLRLAEGAVAADKKYADKKYTDKVISDITLSGK